MVYWQKCVVNYFIGVKNMVNRGQNDFITSCFLFYSDVSVTSGEPTKGSVALVRQSV